VITKLGSRLWADGSVFEGVLWSVWATKK
jgi:hypothetical protein